jgi:hypothetical protein
MWFPHLELKAGGTSCDHSDFLSCGSVMQCFGTGTGKKTLPTKTLWTMVLNTLWEREPPLRYKNKTHHDWFLHIRNENMRPNWIKVTYDSTEDVTSTTWVFVICRSSSWTWSLKPEAWSLKAWSSIAVGITWPLWESWTRWFFCPAASVSEILSSDQCRFLLVRTWNGPVRLVLGSCHGQTSQNSLQLVNFWTFTVTLFKLLTKVFWRYRGHFKSQGFDNLAGGWEHIQAMGESASLIV